MVKKNQRNFSFGKEKFLFFRQVFDKSPVSSISQNSLSSCSPITTSFSSDDDQMIICSSSSSSFDPIFNKKTLKNCEEIYIDRTWPTENIRFDLPMSTSRVEKDRFFKEFHENLLVHQCNGLHSIIDEVLQQQTMRIHRRSNFVLIENQQIDCINTKSNISFSTNSIKQKFYFSDLFPLTMKTKQFLPLTTQTT